MKKNKKISKVPRPFKRRPAPEERVKEAFANVPKITNETVAEHREDVLGSARKYIYPLKHSRRRAVFISSSIFAIALVVFLAFVSVSLYRFQSTSGFIYGVTKVIPFPIAKAGSSWVSYNSYLFELKHYMHYYATQQSVDFESESGKEQLANFKKQALEQVSNDAYVKQLAKKHGVRVSDRAVNDQVELMRSQNRLGTSEREFDEVLNEFWGWNQTDFKRALKQQLLAQAVAAKLDTETVNQANTALSQLKGGVDFATLASQISEDEASKGNGGQYAAPIERDNTELAPPLLAELFRLQPGQYSEVINTGYALEIVKVNSNADGKVQASHIVFTFNSIDDYIKPLRDQNKPQNYIKV
jgi:hypothetical protein